MEREIRAPRPAILNAAAFYLLAAAGLFLLPQLYAFLPASVARYVPLATIEQLGLFALPATLVAAGSDGAKRAMRLHMGSRPCAGLSALAALPAALFGAGITSLWSLLLPPAAESVSYGGAPAISILVGACLLPAACEELFFRGLLSGAWEARGSRRALVAVSCLFLVCHGSVRGLPAQLCVCFVPGFTLLASGTLLAPVLFHAVFNVSSVLLTRFVSFGSVGEALCFTLIAAALTALTLLLLVHFMKREGRDLFPEKPDTSEEIDWQTTLVLSAAVVTCLARYLLDALALFGVI